MEVYKRPSELKAGDLIGVSAQALGKPGEGFFKVQVINVMCKVGIWHVTSAGGTFLASNNQLFPIFEDDMHRDDLTPQFPRKQTRTGRSID